MNILKHYDADTLRECRCSMTPCGDLVILREYECGCLVYLDELEREFNERGLFCQSQAEHAQKLVRGEETQPALF